MACKAYIRRGARADAEKIDCATAGGRPRSWAERALFDKISGLGFAGTIQKTSINVLPFHSPAVMTSCAGVDSPDRWGDMTASQMSAGVDILPRHYVTLWEALGTMTSPDISQSEWSID
jgi:hypothetical protein